MDAESLLRPAVEPAGAEWIAPRLLPWRVSAGGYMSVGAIVPTGFDAYARVFHPAYRWADGRQEPVRWAEIARGAGMELHVVIRWDEIAPPPGQEPPERLSPPQEGQFPTEEAEAVVQVLRRHTAAPDRCWFAIWDGFGGLWPDERWPGVARLHLPSRDYVLLRGPIEAASRSFMPSPSRQSANLWWPEDRAWCVATEIDNMWTYVGGTEACIEALLASSRLEVLRTRPDHRASGRRPAEAEKSNRGLVSRLRSWTKRARGSASEAAPLRAHR